MGLVDIKAKAAAFDKAQEEARRANTETAQNAAEVAHMTASQLAAENAYLKQGLAAQLAPRYAGNLQGYPLVPGQEMGNEYRMPAAQPTSITGQDPRFNEPLMREALAGQSNGGLANTLNTQNQYKGIR